MPPGSRIPSHELVLGPVKVSLLRGNGIPVAASPVHHLVEALPVLPVVLDDLGEAVVQPITIEGEVELVLVGQLVKNPGLVLGGYIQEGFEPVRIGRVVEDLHIQADQRSGGHLDKLPLASNRFVGKVLDVGIGRVADVDHPDVCLNRQAAAAAPLEDLTQFLRQFGAAEVFFGWFPFPHIGRVYQRLARVSMVRSYSAGFWSTWSRPKPREP